MLKFFHWLLSIGLCCVLTEGFSQLCPAFVYNTQCATVEHQQPDVQRLLLTQAVIAGTEPSSHPGNIASDGTNGKDDTSLTQTLRHRNQPLLLAMDSVVLECTKLGPAEGWAVQGDVKIEVGAIPIPGHSSVAMCFIIIGMPISSS